ncbi:hypothetical protein [Sinisalibacter aestuarii]|uniref:DUF4239 domain-containing protein n=1 Tax=Sinisalibacter aestuarii TaxID=2949426 RepID=A0ABQ5LTQ8_9RHOB|nr:hypothetical protein [Sinisalibacter aestuarii]GKY88370.1 hypothetical protein STA1M1_22390 [Sinisalibacter aestuarii]
MVSLLLSLPAIFSALAFVAATIALALGSYLGMRAIFGHHGDSERRELAGSVIFRVSALHGLILALVFAQEIANETEADNAASHEARLVADTFYDLERYDRETTLQIRTALAHYARQVTDVEWRLLADERQLDSAAWAHWNAAYEGALTLHGDTPRHEVLRDNILRNIREISSLRRTRETAAFHGAEPLFLIAALVGVVLTSAAYFTFEPTRLNILLLSIFASYSGLIIYFIIAFSNPFHAPGMASPVGFERILEGGIGQLAGGGG